MLAAVEGRVEAGDLRDVRQPRMHGLDAGHVVGLVQRREGNPLPQLGEAGIVDRRRGGVDRPAMHDAMPHRRHAPAGGVVFDPVDQLGEGGVVGFAVAGEIEQAVFHLAAVVVADGQMGAAAGADALDLADELRRRRQGRRRPVEGELDRGRAGVEGEDRIRHGERLKRRAGRGGRGR